MIDLLNVGRNAMTIPNFILKSSTTTKPKKTDEQMQSHARAGRIVLTRRPKQFRLATREFRSLYSQFALYAATGSLS